MADRPIQKWRIGNIEAALWENRRTVNGDEFTYWTVSLGRSFKKKDEGVWRSEVINNLRRNDIPKLMAILQRVQDHLFFEVKKPGKEEEDEE